MANKTIYFETVRNGLVPVHVAEVHEYSGEIVVEVRRTTGAYKAGDKFVTSRLHLVHKTRVSNGIQYVSQASI